MKEQMKSKLSGKKSSIWFEVSNDVNVRQSVKYGKKFRFFLWIYQILNCKMNKTWNKWLKKYWKAKIMIKMALEFSESKNEWISIPFSMKDKIFQFTMSNGMRIIFVIHHLDILYDVCYGNNSNNLHLHSYLNLHFYLAIKNNAFVRNGILEDEKEENCSHFRWKLPIKHDNANCKVPMHLHIPKKQTDTHSRKKSE